MKEKQGNKNLSNIHYINSRLLWPFKISLYPLLVPIRALSNLKSQTTGLYPVVLMYLKSSYLLLRKEGWRKYSSWHNNRQLKLKEDHNIQNVILKRAYGKKDMWFSYFWCKLHLQWARFRKHAFSLWPMQQRLKFFHLIAQNFSI